MENELLGSTAHSINQQLLIKISFVPGPNSEAWGEKSVLPSTGNYVSNIFKLDQKWIKVVPNITDSSTDNSVSLVPNGEGRGILNGL